MKRLDCRTIGDLLPISYLLIPLSNLFNLVNDVPQFPFTEEVRNMPQAAAYFDGENMPRIADLRMVQEPLEDGVAGISFLGRAHVTASR